MKVQVKVINPSLASSRVLFTTTNQDRVQQRVEAYLDRIGVTEVISRSTSSKRHTIGYIHPITGVNGFVEIKKLS